MSLRNLPFFSQTPGLYWESESTPIPLPPPVYVILRKISETTGYYWESASTQTCFHWKKQVFVLKNVIIFLEYVLQTGQEPRWELI